MRRIPGAKPGTLSEFIPEAFGNRADADPIRVWLKVPSEGDKRQYLVDIMERIDVSSLVPGQTPKVALTIADALERKRKGILRFVDHVEGYSDQAGESIATADDLWTRGELAICNEVEAAIDALLALSSDEKKDSPAPSASSTAASSARPGSASVAIPALPPTATATGPVAMSPS
jgi:hypothetical protein